MMWSISYALSFQIILPEHLSQPLNQLKKAVSEPGMKAVKYALIIFCQLMRNVTVFLIAAFLHFAIA